MTLTLTKIYSFVDQPIELTIEYAYHKGYPQSRDDPGEPDQCEVLSATGQRQMLRHTWVKGEEGHNFRSPLVSYVADGEPFKIEPPWLTMIAVSEEIEEDMLEAALGALTPDPDEAHDRRSDF